MDERVAYPTSKRAARRAEWHTMAKGKSLSKDWQQVVCSITMIRMERRKQCVKELLNVENVM